MKRTVGISTLIAFCLSTSASAVMIYEGTVEILTQGSYQFRSEDGPALDLKLGAGIFVFDSFKVGAFGSVADSDNVRQYGVGLNAEYMFDTGTVLIPFVGVSLGWSESRFTFARNGASQREKSDGLLVGLEAGGKYFIAENIAIALSYLFEWANDDIFSDGDQVEDTNHSIQLGMRFYF